MAALEARGRRVIRCVDTRVVSRLLLAAVGAIVWGAPSSSLRAQTLRLEAGAGPEALRAIVSNPQGPDTVIVLGGRHLGPFLVERPLVLVGRDRPILDGRGVGHVVEARAPFELRGFQVRGSGARVDTEDAGIMVVEAPASIVDNLLEDVFYGIYLKASRGSLVAENEIHGMDLPPPRRGDGIRLWQSPGSTVRDNRVLGTRDVVIYFSDGLSVESNVIMNGRYGLHYMYSHDNRVVGNRFAGNEVGAFIMYSRRIRLEDNQFERSAGASGIGLGLKDSGSIEASGNQFFGNLVGVHLDNSPGDGAAENRFARNIFVANDVGVRLLPSVEGNRFEANDLIANRAPVEVAGGAASAQVRGNRWVGNHWSEYAGFDDDRDNVGDTPFEWNRLADQLVGRYPALALFRDSAAFALLDLLSRFFPLVRPTPLVVDPVPAVSAVTGSAARGSARPDIGAWVPLSWLAAALGAAFSVRAMTRIAVS